MRSYRTWRFNTVLPEMADENLVLANVPLEGTRRKTTFWMRLGLSSQGQGSEGTKTYTHTLRDGSQWGSNREKKKKNLISLP